MVDDFVDTAEHRIAESDKTRNNTKAGDVAVRRERAAHNRLIDTGIGFLVAPLVPGLLVTIPGMIGGHDTSFWLKFSALIGYPVAFVGGIPLHFLFTRNNWVQLRFYCGAGIPLGIAALIWPYLQAVIVGGKGATGGTQLFFNSIIAVIPVFLPLSIVCAAIASTSFWFMVRPDRGREAGS
jgi:hypothetical protein